MYSVTDQRTGAQLAQADTRFLALARAAQVLREGLACAA
jgi:hypothetical protein